MADRQRDAQNLLIAHLVWAAISSPLPEELRAWRGVLRETLDAMDCANGPLAPVVASARAYIAAPPDRQGATFARLRHEVLAYYKTRAAQDHEDWRAFHKGAV